MALTINAPKDLVKIKGIFPPITWRAMANIHTSSKRRLYCSGANHLRCNVAPPLEEHHETIDPLQAIKQVMQNQW